MHFSLDGETRFHLLLTARHAIASAFGAHVDPLPDAPEGCMIHAGCFVSLHTAEGDLRGCIGTFRDDRPILDNVREMAVQAAFSDPRFPPLTPKEFAAVDIEISALSPLEPATLDDIIIGIHGVALTYGGKSGVLLPQVATQMGWGKGAFLEGLCRKAGMLPGTWQKEDAELKKFSAVIFSE